MISWIAQNRYRLPLILGIYFALHVAARTALSSSLDFDESELAFLSQYFSLGYNSQPPLYSWIQTGMLEALGYGVMPLALLKNVLLWLTYLLVFVAIGKITGDLRLGAVASLGMFTIPQIAWESHRDLSHTVAATCATTLLFYCIVSLRKEQPADPTERNTVFGIDRLFAWYALLGFSVGVGILFKYNFAIVVLGFIAASVSIRGYRNLVLDRRIAISVLIAAALILPHALWMQRHAGLASAKTVSTMTENQSDIWLENVTSGFIAMGCSTAACISLTIATFFTLFVRRQTATSPDKTSCQVDCLETRLLLERFLLTVFAILCLIVLTGQAVEFKNRWLQPFVCLVPAYLTVAFGRSVLSRARAMDFSACMTVALMVFIVTALAARPMLSGYRGKYCRLNFPYRQALTVIDQRCQQSPDFVIAPTMRVAGNMRLRYPDAQIISEDAKHLIDNERLNQPGPKRVRVILDYEMEEMIEGADVLSKRLFGSMTRTRDSDWVAIDIPYLYGRSGDQKRFLYREFECVMPGEAVAKLSERREASKR